MRSERSWVPILHEHWHHRQTGVSVQGQPARSPRRVMPFNQQRLGRGDAATFASFGLLLLLISHGPAQSAEWQPQVVPADKPMLTAATLYCRCFIRVPDNMTSRADVDLWTDSAMFSFADFPGHFTVFLNAQKVAEGESLPAEPRRRFKVSKGILEKKAFNILALRLE